VLAELLLAQLPKLTAGFRTGHDNAHALGRGGLCQHPTGPRGGNDDGVEARVVHGLEVLSSHDPVDAQREGAAAVQYQTARLVEGNLAARGPHTPDGERDLAHSGIPLDRLDLNLVVANEHSLGGELEGEGTVREPRDAARFVGGGACADQPCPELDAVGHPGNGE